MNLPVSSAPISADMPQGTVLAVAEDRITLAIDSGCAHCGHGNACGVGQLAAGRRARIDIDLIDDLSLARLQPGDRVCLAAPENALAAALLGYFLPALAMLAGAGGGQGAGGGDLFAVFGASAGFIAALLLTRFCARRFPTRVRIERLPTFPPPTEHCHER